MIIYYQPKGSDSLYDVVVEAENLDDGRVRLVERTYIAHPDHSPTRGQVDHFHEKYVEKIVSAKVGIEILSRLRPWANPLLKKLGFDISQPIK